MVVIKIKIKKFRQYPIGVLFDALGNTTEIPWNLIVHLQGFPPELIRCPSDTVAKSFFNNLLKEVSSYDRK